MSKVKITIKGVAAELALGNYMPSDKTIFNNWEEFYNYNDILHNTQLISNHISEIEISVDDKIIFKGLAPKEAFKKDKSILPKMIENNIYLRTECAENAEFIATAEIENFDLHKLSFATQDYDLIFKTANSFVSALKYDDIELKLEWIKGEPIGNICLLCGYQNGYLLPVYDAINKKYAKNTLN